MMKTVIELGLCNGPSLGHVLEVTIARHNNVFIVFVGGCLATHDQGEGNHRVELI